MLPSEQQPPAGTDASSNSNTGSASASASASGTNVNSLDDNTLPPISDFYAFPSAHTQHHMPRPQPVNNAAGDWSHGYSTLRMPPPDLPFSPHMRDLQARGKDPYEFTRRKDPYYKDRLESVRAAHRRSKDDPPVPLLSPHFVRTPSPTPLEGGTTDMGIAPLDNFANLERRRLATTVLDSPELLMMYAQSLNDSIPAVRMAFMSMMCGYDSDTIMSPTALAARGLSARDAYGSDEEGDEEDDDGDGDGYDDYDNGEGSSSGNGRGSASSRASRGKHRKR